MYRKRIKNKLDKITFSVVLSYIIIIFVVLTVILPFAHELAKSLG